ncbi:18235_t:CDS:2, partial [Acaulospora morrowiae]
LHFATTLFNEEQREIDAEALKSDLKEMTTFLEKIEGGIIDSNNNINTVLKEVQIIKSQLERNSAIGEVKTAYIDPKDLTDPQVGRETDTRGDEKSPIVKKLLNRSTEVACNPKPKQIKDDGSVESQKIKTQLVILGKLKDSPNILKFYGLSEVSDREVMVFEWAEHGSLKEVYERHDISWRSKVQVALDICRGLVFLHTCEILHHDIRCANIMMTARLEPKISNFSYARHDSEETTKLKNFIDAV